MGLEQTIGDFAQLKEESSKKASELQELRSKIREQIKNGETTGDKIKDYLIVVGAQYPDGEFTRSDFKGLYHSLRILDRKIKESQLEVFMLVKERESISGCTGFGHKGFKSKDAILEIGFLNGELRFDFSPHSEFNEGKITIPPSPEVIIPTSKYATMDNSRFERKLGLVEKDMGIDMHYLPGLDKHLPEFGPLEKEISIFNSSIDRVVNYFVGDEVPLYFKIHPIHRDHILERLRRGELTGEKLAELMNTKLIKDIDTMYVAALNLLGKSAPEEFHMAYNGQIYDGKVKIVTELIDLIKNEKKISGRINEIMGSVDNDLVDDVAATLISSPLRDEIKDIRRDIGCNLREAVQLDMDKTPWVLDIGEKGEQIDVPRYVKGLIDKYELSIKQ